jgi:hypothetical protein
MVFITPLLLLHLCIGKTGVWCLSGTFPHYGVWAGLFVKVCGETVHGCLLSKDSAQLFGSLLTTSHLRKLYPPSMVCGVAGYHAFWGIKQAGRCSP